MGFRCGITGQASPPGVKPVVISYYVAREYHGNEFISRGRELVREVLALPEVAPSQREVTLEGVRTGKASDSL